MRCFAAAVLWAAILPGCATPHNQYKEDGPAVTENWNTATADDVYARFEPAPQQAREWNLVSTSAADGSVTHGPLYFEDPFVDKGSGHTDHRLGWEDWVAFPYGLARHYLNTVAFPVSAVVTPPWTRMVSDGELSKQALGYDHDATRADDSTPQPPPAAQQEASTP